MRDSFEEYVTASSGRLLRFAYVLCGDRFLAEDLVQDVLSRTHRDEMPAGIRNPAGHAIAEHVPGAAGHDHPYRTGRASAGRQPAQQSIR